MSYRSRSLMSALAVLFITVFLVSTSRAQAPTERLAIIETNTAEFPQVGLVVRAFDSEGKVVSGLLPADFQITENDKPMIIESLEEEDGHLWVHFVIDAGAGMTGNRWTKAKEAILIFLSAGSWMRNGFDQVAISAIEANGTRTVSDFTSDRAKLVNDLERYTPPGGEAFTTIAPPMVDLIEQLNLKPQAKDRPKYFILLTGGLENETGRRTLIETAQTRDVILNTVLARNAARIPCSGTGVCDENLRDMALETGGEFAAFADRNSLNGMFTRMEAGRRQYALSYRSNIGASGTHQVVVSHPDGAKATTSFTVAIDPIRVLIDAPKEGEIIVREAAAFTEDRGSIPPTSYTVTASAIFPDIRRRILQAELLVNGVVAGKIEYPGEAIEIPWSLRGITGLGVNEQTLQVRIKDELGLESVSQPSNIKVEVIVPEKSVLGGIFDGPGSTTVITQTVIATPVPIPCPSQLPEAACGPYRAVRGNWISATSLIVALLALGFAGIVWLNRDKAIVRNATARVTKAVETLTRRQSTAKARAYLKILAGDEDVDRLLPIHGDTRIGRSPHNADIHFKSHQEESVISRLHCTIIDMETHFEIKDESSTYGTYLNGSRLTPLVLERLSDGDEIELAQVQTGGVKLKFQEIDETIDDDASTTRRTRDKKGGQPEARTEVDAF